MYILKVFDLICKSSFPGEKKKKKNLLCHIVTQHPITLFSQAGRKLSTIDVWNGELFLSDHLLWLKLHLHEILRWDYQEI